MNAEYLNQLPAVDKKAADQLAAAALKELNKKIIVLDDDPTGVQTVNNISVFTDWSKEAIEAGFQEDSSMFFILTNSRGLTVKETEEVHREIAENILSVASKLNKEFIIISRGDSTLRGHYPLETAVIRKTLEAGSSLKIDGEVILPYFKEGGRFTINNIHYVQTGTELIPAGETEFAKDRTFGYSSSHLGEWVEEKSNGEFPAKNTLYISIEQLRAQEVDNIAEQLTTVTDFNKIVVNAADEADVKIFTAALVKAIQAGKNFLFRSAAALPKVIGGVQDRGLLTRGELVKEETTNGGLIIVGSHVKKTTEQLDKLKELTSIEFIEFQTNLVLEPDKFQAECERVIETVESLITAGKTVAVYTSRKRLDLGENKKEEELKLSVSISDAVTSIVTKLKVRPNFLVAKGGITSSDVGTKGLGVKRATVAGQIRPGIPVWITGEESKYPRMSYVIFPGNVGTVDDLKTVVQILGTQA
ncbi:four-carbon acid sugar kinase family protein [Niallia sp. Man26]|uniref:four-carbon acid sugar kinase family protein n=1 Tax=Niallia sp. Man26 TaxID=2912824 RepID=UPI001EDB1420|nr:four-carbon acid sugar kinase family protein [Niallia sp. Man26]UPO89751.1 hydroxyacid dehydrogenase [Niallia sp. Man26]